MSKARADLIGRAVFSACDPFVRASVARREHPDRYTIKRVAERALHGLREQGKLPAGIDITVEVKRGPARASSDKRFKLQVSYSRALYEWINAEALS